MHLKTPEERQAIAKKGVATRKANREIRDKERQEAWDYADGLKVKIKGLEQRLSSLDYTYKMSAISASLTNKTLLQAEEIVRVALPWNMTKGVYFLVHKDEVVYVGQSNNVYSRISQHVDKVFDKFAFVQCEANLMNKLESLYIHVLKPKLNGNTNAQEKNAPIRFNKLINMV